MGGRKPITRGKRKKEEDDSDNEIIKLDDEDASEKLDDEDFEDDKSNGKEKDKQAKLLTGKLKQAISGTIAKKIKLSPPVVDMEPRFKQLRDRYESLKNARLTDAEKLYKQYKEASVVREAAATQLIDKLKQEVTYLRTRSGASGLPPSDPVLDFFCSMTAVKVECKAPNIFYCICESPSKRSHVRFEITVHENDQIEYNPIEVHTETKLVPECVKEPIYFNKSEWPIFLCKVITSVFSE
eukprot:TRINITY_DN7590_c0_g1_i1.p1 TRINITY_DN7590_c0_g1~~TRINITY_DN7590_c0_g1_i1.p1  ORF type:complete len:240 (+),score=64.77 TRINITY_DN7590_c0_g1_i1:122-841(+)